MKVEAFICGREKKGLGKLPVIRNYRAGNTSKDDLPEFLKNCSAFNGGVKLERPDYEKIAGKPVTVITADDDCHW